MSALDTILSSLREQSPHQRHQGTYFENLALVYLREDKYQASQYSEVWTHKEWAHKHKELHEQGADTGIDLVAKLRDEEGFAAVQCKFYESDRKIDKDKLNNFLSISSKKHFRRRIFIDTSEVPWTKNAREALRNQSPPVVTVGIDDLRSSSLDWEEFEKHQKVVQREKREILNHQKEAVEAITEGFASDDRGKLIMACGTGKTYTALKVAEAIAGAGGRVLFLMPSLALIAQAIREWSLDSEIPLRSFAVCSDSHVGRSRQNPDDKIQVEIHDLAFPATTKPSKVAQKAGGSALDRMTVIFSTYQSIQVLNEAQKQGLPEFDLIVCDEAHRTTGVTLSGEDESNFVRVHDNKFVKAKKRLYMTATPRIFGEGAQKKAKRYSAELSSMENEGLYGKVFYEKTFGSAVEDNLLTDYKVVVLAVQDGVISTALEGKLTEDSELKLGDATKIVGCYRALQKKGRRDEFKADPAPMRRAIAFCKQIKSSKLVQREFAPVADEFNAKILPQDEVKNALKCKVKHVDGNFNASERITLLNWLGEEHEKNECRILSNARCLSEGVDVPALDAVLFMHPRKSQIDVVQAVGRVMRKAEGKNLGYVILPVVIPTDVSAEEALKKNESYKVIWQVLNALRSHDERLEAEINKIDLNQGTGNHIDIIGIGQGGDEDDDAEDETEELKQARLAVDDFIEAIQARIVDKCGDREYWQTWAKDIGDIARVHILRIKDILASGEAEREIFAEFLKAVRGNINQSITEDQAIELLAQHLVTKPVFEAIFENYDFAKRNAVSEAMQKVVDVLEPKNLSKEAEVLEGFYASVKRRAEGIESAEDRQKIIKDLYNNFFNMAFKGTSKKLGVVYTPIEVVDFIIHSVNDILKQEFGKTLGSKDVHILDPFTGTGTFITRLLQSGLIAPQELEHKYKEKIHANEIILLAYYIAAVNIENVYQGIMQGAYEPFNRIVLTDTFMMGESETLESNLMEKNNKRRNEQRDLKDIQVIISNPPYNVGSKGVEYENLDGRIADTYVLNTQATNKNSLYDSYIQAIRWASDRIGDRGVIGFVTNAGWIDGIAMDGMRKCLKKDFTNIYVFNLRGNQRTVGELSKREGGKIFGGGSRAPIAISLLVKNPNAKKHGQIFYHDIGDYLSQKQKLQTIQDFKSIKGIEAESLWTNIQPDQFNDWINHRDPSFYNHLLISEKGTKEVVLFANYTAGLKTQRDAWCYNASRIHLESNIQRTIDYFNSQISAYNKAGRSAKAKNFCKANDKEIKWTPILERNLRNKEAMKIKDGQFVKSLYRPFTKQWLYYSQQWNERVYQMPRVFPHADISNRTIAIAGPGTLGGFDVMMHDTISDLGALSASQNFPLKLFEEIKEPKAGDKTSLLDEDEVITGYKETDGITDYGLKYFQDSYNSKQITKEDIFYYVYGLFHSPRYRDRFANNLMKQMPRIPAVKKFDDFKSFAKAGRDLGELHINYESAERYKTSFTNPTLFTETKDGIPIPLDNTDLKDFYRVEKMKFAGKQANPDKTMVIYNSNITITKIPESAYKYMIGGRSALEWVMEWQRGDKKAEKKSGIVNDANDYANETMDDPAYPLKLFQRIITVSLETQKIVAALPKLDID